MLRRPNASAGHFTSSGVKTMHPNGTDNIAQAMDQLEGYVKPEENVFKKQMPIKKPKSKFQRD